MHGMNGSNEKGKNMQKGMLADGGSLGEHGWWELEGNTYYTILCDSNILLQIKL
jgi:hypothetical protein